MLEIDLMTWRRFRVLLAGLSSDSRLACALSEDSNAPLTGKAAEAAFKRF